MAERIRPRVRAWQNLMHTARQTAHSTAFPPPPQYEPKEAMGTETLVT